MATCLIFEALARDLEAFAMNLDALGVNFEALISRGTLDHPSDHPKHPRGIWKHSR
ncbi:hypothetical protein [Bhargavaea beijingensis]|uniref:hypothetical protein n=1 Tax=Bhargavaea beijingensis TaxID=426756 RepID=UPI0015A03906|nr:hypothetical protein [Bhargavaea beijingensis]